MFNSEFPEKKFRTKAICGLTKEELIHNFRSALENYRIKTVVETTTYLHHSGYHQDWWNVLFDILLKRVHIRGTSFYGSVLNAYQHYLSLKQNGTNVSLEKSVGWHMCLVATYVAVSEKTKQFNYDRKKQPFFYFIYTEGSDRPAKLKIIQKQMESCLEECVNDISFMDALGSLHYILREDYGHNKYIPQLMEKIITTSLFKQNHAMRSLQSLYEIVPGNRRYLCPIIMLHYFYENYEQESDFTRFEQQADYFYNRTIRKIKNYYEEQANEKYQNPTRTQIFHTGLTRPRVESFARPFTHPIPTEDTMFLHENPNTRTEMEDSDIVPASYEELRLPEPSIVPPVQSPVQPPVQTPAFSDVIAPSIQPSFGGVTAPSPQPVQTYSEQRPEESVDTSRRRTKIKIRMLE